MHSKLLLLALLFFSHVFQSKAFCVKETMGIYKYNCGEDCTGTPGCGEHDCGDVSNMCYCDCGDNIATAKCEQTHDGWKWNDGIKLANGSYALNGTKGDGKEYKC